MGRASPRPSGLARARKLYAEAGYSRDNPLKVQILYKHERTTTSAIAIAVAGMWKQALGVKTELFNQEWKVYLTTRRAKQFEVLRAGWIGDYNDANTFLELLKGGRRHHETPQATSTPSTTPSCARRSGKPT